MRSAAPSGSNACEICRYARPLPLGSASAFSRSGSTIVGFGRPSVCAPRRRFSKARWRQVWLQYRGQRPRWWRRGKCLPHHSQANLTSVSCMCRSVWTGSDSHRLRPRVAGRARVQPPGLGHGGGHERVWVSPFCAPLRFSGDEIAGDSAAGVGRCRRGQNGRAHAARRRSRARISSPEKLARDVRGALVFRHRRNEVGRASHRSRKRRYPLARPARFGERLTPFRRRPASV